MIYGIGVDIVRIARMQHAVERFGERFVLRILSEREHLELSGSAQAPRFLATRFAAKEAFAKALGTGFRDGLSLREVGVDHDASGRPFLTCTGRAVELLRLRAVAHIHLSLTDEADYACAVVALETSGPRIPAAPAAITMLPD